MTRYSRRTVLRGSSVVAGTLLAGCSTGVLTGGNGSDGAGNDAPALDDWVPKPSEVSGRDHYLLSDAVFWNLAAIRPFEDDLHPSFYERVSSTPDANALGVSPAEVDARVDVASQSASVYLGSFDAAAVKSTLLDEGLAVNRTAGDFETLAPGDAGYQHPVAVSDAAVVVGKGASFQMAGGDGESSEIAPQTVLAEVIETHRTDGAAYADESDAFRTLSDAVRSFAGGTVRTFERVPEAEQDGLRIAGTVGFADGFRFDRPKSEYVTLFLFDDASDVAADPVKEVYANHPGLSEFEDVTYETDGATLRVTARMANERFDGYLDGDPGSRA